MRILRRFASAFRAMIRRDREDAELDEELREYLAEAVDTKVASGSSREEAVRQARVEMGSPAAVKDWVRDIGWESRLESLWQDIRYGVRMLRRAPGFALAAVASLSIGLAATTATFSAINAILLRSVPAVRDPAQLAHVYLKAPWLAGPAARAEDYERLREALPAFSGLAAFAETTVAAGVGGEQGGGDRHLLSQGAVRGLQEGV